MLKIRRNDIVSVLSGKEKGKKGKVLRVFPAAGRALVENLNLVKKSRRRTQDNQQGGIVAQESPIAISNLMLICKQCDKPARFTSLVLKDGSKSRQCKSCGGAM
jgi:large subunit ribosomal protein L24